MSEERRGKYKSAGKHAAIIEDVKQRAQALHKSKRRNVVSAKRKMGQEEEPTSSAAAANLHEIEAMLKSANSNDQCNGIVQLKSVLAASDPPIQDIIDRGLLSTLAAHVSNIHSKQRFNALCCLTNIATGDHAQTGSVLQHLAGILQPVSDWSQVEQACWIIGNVAGDCYEHRTYLLSNGALQYIWHCLLQCMENIKTNASGEYVSCASVAAWALSNLARGAAPGSIFLELGIVHRLCEYLQSALSLPTLRNEILWCLVFLLAKEEEIVDAMIQNDGIIENLVLVIQSSDLCESESGCIAVIRCLGNLTSGSSHWMNALMAHDAVVLEFLHAMIVRQGGEDTAQTAICKEAIWVLSNIIGGNLIIRHKIINSNILDTVIHCFTHCTFEVQRECIVAFHNALLDAEATPIVEKLCNRSIVLQFVQLLSAHDQEMLLMTISILRRIYNGSAAAKSLCIDCGITDALDALHYGVADEVVKTDAAHLADAIYEDMEAAEAPLETMPPQMVDAAPMGRGIHLTKPAWAAT